MQHFSTNVDLQPSSVKLHVYAGESISVLGQLEVDVTYSDQQVKLPLFIVSGKKQPKILVMTGCYKFGSKFTMLLMILR